MRLSQLRWMRRDHAREVESASSERALRSLLQVLLAIESDASVRRPRCACRQLPGCIAEREQPIVER